jgi:hypothetical protein
MPAPATIMAAEAAMIITNVRDLRASNTTDHSVV